MHSAPVRLPWLAAATTILACGPPAAVQTHLDEPTNVPAAPTTVPAAAAPSSAGTPHKFAFELAPGPIAGRWVTTCSYTADMVVEFTVNGKTAVGRIAVLGQGGLRGYKAGDEVLHLAANDFGHWVGTLHWRSVAGMVREDPINIVATADKLDAIITTDDCYRGMPRSK